MLSLPRIKHDRVDDPCDASLLAHNARNLERSTSTCHTARMKQRTDGRVVRVLTKHHAAEERRWNSGIWLP
jgi:hypothetical protein